MVLAPGEWRQQPKHLYSSEKPIGVRVAHISGWELVDTDNASSTTLEAWWQYMEAQPSIGIPALYFLHRTESTLEEPPETDWPALAGIWRYYIDALPAETSMP